MKDKILAILSLFASTSTLLCCALPTLLVTLGLGAVVASAISSMPWLITLSRYKEWVFLIAGILIIANWIMIKRRRSWNACKELYGGSADTACDTASNFNFIVLLISTALYIIGFTVTFLAFPVGKALGLL